MSHKSYKREKQEFSTGYNQKLCRISWDSLLISVHCHCPGWATGECVSRAVAWAQQWVSAAGWSEQIIPCRSPVKALSSPRHSHRLMARWLYSDALSSQIIKGWAEHSRERFCLNTKGKNLKRKSKEKPCLQRDKPNSLIGFVSDPLVLAFSFKEVLYIKLFLILYSCLGPFSSHMWDASCLFACVRSQKVEKNFIPGLFWAQQSSEPLVQTNTRVKFKCIHCIISHDSCYFILSCSDLHHFFSLESDFQCSAPDMWHKTNGKSCIPVLI